MLTASTPRENKSALPVVRTLRVCVHFSFAAIVIALTGVCCWAQSVPAQTTAEALQGYTYSFPAMGSTFEIAAYTNDAAKLEQTVQAIEAEVQRLNDVFSDYDPSSELESLLASSHPSRLDLSDDLFYILMLSQDWNRKTGGIFDPAIGQLTHLWRKRRRVDNLPTEQEVALAKMHSGWHLVDINATNRNVSFRDPDVKIDLGGIATGYTVDKCFLMLTEAGITCCLINSGGDIRCGSAPPDREGWNIEVAAIEKDKTPLHHLKVRNCAITTSGDLWRYTDVDGIRRSHIIDPQTGYGIPGPTAVTVIARTCLDVDVLGTTLSVMGPERGLSWLAKEFPDAVALFAWKPQGSERIEQVSTPKFFSAGLK